MPEETNILKEYIIKKYSNMMSVTDRQSAIDIATTYALDSRINPQFSNMAAEFKMKTVD
jgi:hypothetical protein